MQQRPLRPFEQGAHLHVLDWAHETARQRFQAAGAVQVKAAAKQMVNQEPDVGATLKLPALEAAVLAELRNLYALGHMTVRSELMYQDSGEPLPVGLSKVIEPPNLRASKHKKRTSCGTCKMFDKGVCWGYGNWEVHHWQVCDSWTAEDLAKQLAAASPSPDGRLRARATLTAASVAHHILDAIHRGRFQGITDVRQLRQLGRDAGNGALGQAASHHAGGAINGGRAAAALNGNGNGNPAKQGRYTSVLDKNTCGPCAEADTGDLMPVAELPPVPNPACLGGDRCRCIIVYELAGEKHLRPPVMVGVGSS